jgi:small subunit ribosomal protein S17e
MYMGKVRTEMIKRISIELLKKYPKSFNPEFEVNKQFLNEIGLDVSKKLRNKVAGYITGLVRIDQAERTELEEELAVPAG